MNKDKFKLKLKTDFGEVAYYSLRKLEEEGIADITRLPYSIRILVENVLRHLDGKIFREEDLIAIAKWKREPSDIKEIPFMPSRVILQDFTGVPAVVDLAAMRSAIYRLGGNPKKVNPIIPSDLIIDHSVQVDFYGTSYAFYKNIEREYERNRERYALLKWAQNAFANFRVIPPGKGIIHQVNLEYLAKVVHVIENNGELIGFPDTVLGTDSHTTMINGLGVLGWGVGGIEAEAVMLGQPYYMPIPEVIGVKLIGEIPEGATATDLVLTITEMLRKKGVVGKFVEYFGPGLKNLSIPDRATIANMAPEYGATIGYFPIDEATLQYLLGTGRDPKHVKFVKRYAEAQKLFWSENLPEPMYTDVIEFDMSIVEPSISGPSHPEDRVPLRVAKREFLKHLKEYIGGKRGSLHHAGISKWENEGGKVITEEGAGEVIVEYNGEKFSLTHGSIVIAAITSCTNTSNPSVMIGAGLLAKKAVERGLRVKPYVKTSLAPGSIVVTEYLRNSGLLPYLEALGFHLVGHGCTTCIGNSGPLPKPIADAIVKHGLYTVAILSGNRNFAGRIHPLVRANYLASPMLVVAYAIAGRMNIDLLNEPLSYDPNGNPVYLKDIWPSQKEIKEVLESALKPELYKEKYSKIFEGDQQWKELPAPKGDLYEWDPNSTYIKEPPFFKNMPLEPPQLEDIKGARVLALLGDRITTDHISPAGAIPPNSPAGKYLIEKGVEPKDFNTYGSRRGNHEVMVRGTFSNIRLRNLLVPDVEGGWTLHFPSGRRLTIYDAAIKYMEENIPLIVIGGKQYGAGSSRDWAAKGTLLLGVKAVIAEDFERIHRSNLIGMGVLPLQFKEGENWRTLGLTGKEVFEIKGISEGLYPRKELTVIAKKEDGTEIGFKVIARLDTPIEVEYYKNGGILQTVLRKFIKEDP